MEVLWRHTGSYLRVTQSVRVQGLSPSLAVTRVDAFDVPTVFPDVQPNYSLMGGKWWSSVDVDGISEMMKSASVAVGGRWWTMVDCCRIGFTRMRSQVQALHRPPPNLAPALFAASAAKEAPPAKTK